MLKSSLIIGVPNGWLIELSFQNTENFFFTRRVCAFTYTHVVCEILYYTVTDENSSRRFLLTDTTCTEIRALFQLRNYRAGIART